MQHNTYFSSILLFFSTKDLTLPCWRGILYTNARKEKPHLRYRRREVSLTDLTGKGIARKPQKRTMIEFKKHIPFYLLLLLPLLQVAVFNYLPIYGVTIAFKDFKMSRGIAGSDWKGLYWFGRILTDPYMPRVLINTLRISFASLLVTFPTTIVFALLVNEISNLRRKKVIQTISYMPHFLSWVVVGGLVKQLLSPNSGVINAMLMAVGAIDSPVSFMTSKTAFLPIYLFTTVWKETGWGIILYLAAISSIDTQQYEAAMLDGANRFQQLLRITLPGMLPTISTILILRMGSLISVGFDPIFNLYNPTTYEVADVISTYIYRRGMADPSFVQYEYASAIGLLQNVVSFLLVLFSNYIARKADPEYRII